MKVAPTASREQETTSSSSTPAAPAAATAVAPATLPVPPPSTSLEEQEQAVFGSTCEDLADAMAEFLDRGIRSGVASLPLLQDPQKSKTLCDMIQKPYMKHIDVMEVYAQRNIFTLRHSAPRRRQLIVQRFRNNNEPSTTDETAAAASSSSSSSTLVGETATTDASHNTVYPNKQDIPSKEELAKLQEELSQLAMQLTTAKDRRNALLKQGASLAATHSLTEGAVQSLEAANLQQDHEIADAVQGPVTAAVMGGQGLQELTREGKRLQTELGKRKQNANHRPEDGENDDELLVHKKRVLTMEEAYRQERQVVETTVENLSSLSNLLKQSKTRIEETN
jgi:hypothetical protein